MGVGFGGSGFSLSGFMGLGLRGFSLRVLFFWGFGFSLGLRALAFGARGSGVSADGLQRLRGPVALQGFWLCVASGSGICHDFGLGL